MSRRASAEDWYEAKRLFECGRSLKNIADTLDIDKASISKRAKNEAWEKAKFQPLIEDTARVRVEISTLEVEVQRTVEKEVEQRVRHIEFFNNATIKNLSLMMKKVDSTIDIRDHKDAQEALNKGRENILGKSPDTAIAINNASPPTDIDARSVLRDLVADYDIIDQS